MIIQPEANTTKDIIHFARQAAATEGTTPPFPLSSPVPLINSFLINFLFVLFLSGFVLRFDHGPMYKVFIHHIK